MNVYQVWKSGAKDGKLIGASHWSLAIKRAMEREKQQPVGDVVRVECKMVAKGMTVKQYQAVLDPRKADVS